MNERIALEGKRDLRRTKTDERAPCDNHARLAAICFDEMAHNICYAADDATRIILGSNSMMEEFALVILWLSATATRMVLGAMSILAAVVALPASSWSWW